MIDSSTRKQKRVFLTVTPTDPSPISRSRGLQDSSSSHDRYQ